MGAFKRQLTGVVRGSYKPPRSIIYGPPKIGKTTLGASMPSPIFICTEEGADNLNVDQFPCATTWEQFYTNIEEVINSDHEYKTLVIDTMNGAANLCAAHVCRESFGGKWTSSKGQEGFDSFGRGWQATAAKITDLLYLLDGARARGMMVTMLAHTGVQTVRNPVTGDFQKFTPDLPKPVWARVSAWVDIILRADFEYVVVVDEQKKKRARGDSKRILIAGGSAAEDAGCRVGYHLPDKLDMSWASIAEHLGTDTETADKLRSLWATLTEPQIDWVLNQLSIESVDQLEQAAPDRARVVLNRIITANDNKEASNVAA